MSFHYVTTIDENIIGVPKMQINYGSIKYVLLLQYCYYSNIKNNCNNQFCAFFIDLSIVIALQLFAQQ
jgi:hypothetical protein